MSAEARGDFAEALLPRAAALAVAVREETREEIGNRLAALSREEVEGLAVVLAALVDPDRSLTEALAWITFDENGEPAPPKVTKTKTIRAAAAVPPLGDARKGIDKVAVYRALSGDTSVSLGRGERGLAVDIGIRSGMDYDELAAILGIDRESVKRTWDRLKKQARAQGRPVPADPVGRIVAAA